MRLCTLTVTDSFTITRDLNVIQWSIAATTSDAVFTINGNTNIGGNASVAAVIGVAGTGAYNSAETNTLSPWDGVIISVDAGSVTLFLTRD